MKRLVKRINFRIKIGDLDDAVALLNLGLKSYPDHPDFLDALARIHMKRGEYELAERYLRDGMMTKQQQRFVVPLALLLISKGKTDEALSLIDETDTTPISRMVMGLSLLKKKADNLQAISIFEDLTKSDKKFLPFLFESQVMSKRYKQAQQTLVQFDSEFIKWYNTAVIEIKLERFQSANSLFSKLENELQTMSQEHLEYLYRNWRFGDAEKLDNLNEFKYALEYYVHLGLAFSLPNRIMAYEKLLELEEKQYRDKFLYLSLLYISHELKKDKLTLKRYLDNLKELNANLPSEYVDLLEEYQ